MSHWFFLSYARENLTDYLKKFYEDLNTTISHLTAPKEGNRGFFDTSDIGVGQQWSHELIAALQNCRVFVPLYSPAYFTSEWCGKEWQFFSERQAAASARLEPSSSRPTLIMPVLWVPETKLPSPLPEAVSAVQYKQSDLGNQYTKLGLYHLMTINKHNDDYHEFVNQFADRLIEAARAHILPPLLQPRPIEKIESAFHRRWSEVAESAGDDVKVGTSFVQFVFVAGRRKELKTLRTKLDPYGEEGGHDWHPYLPEVKDRVGLISQRLACGEDLTSDFMQLDDNIIMRIKEAQRLNKIVVILVDTWTLDLEQYKKPMLAYDDRKFINCVVIVSWNNRDDELTGTMRSRLFNNMRFIFSNHCINPEPNCFLEISSHDELQRVLPTVLNQARARLSVKAEVVKKAEGDQAISKPSISTYGGGASA